MGRKRVTLPLLYVVEALMAAPSSDHWGYRLAQETGLAPGTVQPILTALEDSGWLAARWEPVDPHVVGRRPRRLYNVTGEGAHAMRELLEAHSGRMRRSRFARPGAAPA